jgi:hypothetical protein
METKKNVNILIFVTDGFEINEYFFVQILKPLSYMYLRLFSLLDALLKY